MFWSSKEKKDKESATTVMLQDKVDVVIHYNAKDDNPGIQDNFETKGWAFEEPRKLLEGDIAMENNQVSTFSPNDQTLNTNAHITDMQNTMQISHISPSVKKKANHLCLNKSPLQKYLTFHQSHQLPLL